MPNKYLIFQHPRDKTKSVVELSLFAENDAELIALLKSHALQSNQRQNDKYVCKMLSGHVLTLYRSYAQLKTTFLNPSNYSGEKDDN
jgi:hypothetical protein